MLLSGDSLSLSGFLQPYGSLFTHGFLTGFLAEINSLTYAVFLSNHDSLCGNGFLVRLDSLRLLGFLWTSDSLEGNRFLNHNSDSL